MCEVQALRERTTMDGNTLNGILRAIVPAALAYAVGRGWISQSSVADLTAAALAVGAAIWSVISNRKST